MNLLVKVNDNIPAFFINAKTAIATKLSKKAFERLQALNPELLAGYRYIAAKDVDFSWWGRITNYLTATRIYNNCYFVCDIYGKVTRY